MSMFEIMLFNNDMLLVSLIMNSDSITLYKFGIILLFQEI